MVQVDAHPQRELSQLPLHPLFSSLLDLSIQQHSFFSDLEHEISLLQDFFEFLTPQAIALVGIKKMPRSKISIMWIFFMFKIKTPQK